MKDDRPSGGDRCSMISAVGSLSFRTPISRRRKMGAETYIAVGKPHDEPYLGAVYSFLFFLAWVMVAVSVSSLVTAAPPSLPPPHAQQ